MKSLKYEHLSYLHLYMSSEHQFFISIAQTDLGLRCTNFSLRINKLPIFSETLKRNIVYKIVHMWSDEFTCLILTSQYVLNLRYRLHYIKYKDLHQHTTKSLNSDNILIIITIYYDNINNFCLCI